MAILTPSEAPKKVIRELDPTIEQEINKKLIEGIWEWQIDQEWLHDKPLLIETLQAAGWRVKIAQRDCIDDEVHPWWIELTPIKERTKITV